MMKQYPRAPRCNVTGKEMFPTKHAARDALREYGHRKGCRNVHWCPFCSGYHMTKAERHGGKKRA